ncbi:MAG: Verru_Chthon cassette protein D [Chthoniobacterales bacterium]|nr:Verru_Chthon cassette protein D [Chthoniobacterales bacterium]
MTGTKKTMAAHGPAGSERNRAAFSLLELLVVIAILGIVATLSIPAFSSMSRARNVTQAGQILADHIAQARQQASLKNREVEVRFITVQESGVPVVRAIQLWMANPSGTSPAAIGRVDVLPAGTQIATNATLSPLLTADPTITGTMTVSGYGNCTYTGIRMDSAGSLGGSISGNNFLTIHAKVDTAVPPDNYVTLRVNPVTGRVTEYRR